MNITVTLRGQRLPRLHLPRRVQLLVSVVYLTALYTLLSSLAQAACKLVVFEQHVFIFPLFYKKKNYLHSSIIIKLK